MIQQLVRQRCGAGVEYRPGDVFLKTQPLSPIEYDGKLAERCDPNHSGSRCLTAGRFFGLFNFSARLRGFAVVQSGAGRDAEEIASGRVSVAAGKTPQLVAVWSCCCVLTRQTFCSLVIQLIDHSALFPRRAEQPLVRALR